MCLCGWFFANAQDSLSRESQAQQHLQRAHQFFKNQQLTQAQLVYERVVFLSKSKTLQNEALLYKTYCHKQLKQFKEAQATIERAEVLPEQDSVNYILLYEASLTAYLAQEYKQSLKFIDILKTTVQDSSKIKSITFLEILALNETYQWEKAKQLCAQYIKDHQLEQDIDALYGFVDKKPFKSIKKAKTLSWIFPGAGQMYAGAVGRGISSSVLTLGALTFGVFSAINGYYVSAFFTGLGLGRTFYTGGRRHAGYQVQQRNLKKIAAYHQKIKDFILKVESQK
ncbi:hypothetical protein BKI52_40705 [marine bacterium AO1-C]|nr:hypothetical protein BKI52_40705 [marine bacterium AO1-C]